MAKNFSIFAQARPGFWRRLLAQDRGRGPRREGDDGFFGYSLGRIVILDRRGPAHIMNDFDRYVNDEYIPVGPLCCRGWLRQRRSWAPSSTRGCVGLPAPARHARTRAPPALSLGVQ